MLLLDQIDLRRLKQDLETKVDFCTHTCENCGSFLRITWKDSKSKKAVNGESCDVMHAR